MNKIFEQIRNLKLGEGINKLLGGSLLAVFGAVVGWKFTDRDKSLTEMTAYDKYITEVIVLNDNPVKKRMLAQYFSSVTPSDDQQEKWEKYYYEVQKDFEGFIRKDSLNRLKFSSLIDKQLKQEVLSPTELWELDELKQKLAVSNSYFNSQTQLPNNKQYSSTNSGYTIYIQSTANSSQKANKVKDVLIKQGFNVPAIETKEGIEVNDIRYYFDEDAQKVLEISDLLNETKIDFKLKNFKHINSSVKSNLIEIWIK